MKPDAAREAALLHMAGGAACEGQILLPVLLEREGSDLCRANVITSALARAEVGQAGAVPPNELKTMTS